MVGFTLPGQKVPPPVPNGTFGRGGQEATKGTEESKRKKIKIYHGKTRSNTEVNKL